MSIVENSFNEQNYPKESVIIASKKTVLLLLEIKKQLDWLNQFGTVYVPMEYFEELIGNFSVEIFQIGFEAGRKSMRQRDF
jgi:hypothetical protein